MPRGLIEINAETLRAERERAGFSVEDISRRTGLDLATLRRIEDGPARNLRPATVRRLALAIGIDAEVLSTGSA